MSDNVNLRQMSYQEIKKLVSKLENENKELREEINELDEKIEDMYLDMAGEDV